MMADQCIVCLETLEVEHAIAPDRSAPNTSDTIHPAPSTDHPEPIQGTFALQVTESLCHDSVAQIQVCGHMLHETCLREWSDKANSCPICRQTFYDVNVYDKVGGTFRSRSTPMHE